MSDSDSDKKSRVPLWQLKPGESVVEETETTPAETPSRAIVIEKAKKFLQEDEVKDASADKKIQFLETKGLTKEEIEGLLGVSSNEEATSLKTSESSEQSLQAQVPKSQAAEQPSAPEAQPPPPEFIQRSPPPQPSHDTPPIITYPEFLIQPTSPSPLVTRNRLITTLYLFGGLSALLYGTNTYLVTPMLASLTESRLSLASTASSNLRKLITKLESMVSEIPLSITSKNALSHEKREEDSESDEDPTELFHRDIGIQTSLPPSPAQSPSTPSFVPPTPLSSQTTRLNTLSTSLSSLLTHSTSEGDTTNELDTTIKILKEYLEGLAYETPSYSYGGSYNSIYGASKDSDKNDEIARVKAGIRGVKGVLLSARSFPGGVRRS